MGIVECYAQDMARFAACFDLDPGQLQGARANRNPERASEGGYALEPAQERLIRRCNARDLALYERALRG